MLGSEIDIAATELIGFVVDHHVFIEGIRRHCIVVAEQDDADWGLVAELLVRREL